MQRIAAELLKIGDTIMPPERELRLWMRKRAEQMGLMESALQCTIVDIQEEIPDKRGRWLRIKTSPTAEWVNGKPYFSTFKVRPNTPWSKVA